MNSELTKQGDRNNRKTRLQCVINVTGLLHGLREG